METEIDLRPLVTALFRRWRLIVLCMVIAAFIAMLVAMLSAQTYTARADILMLSSRLRLAFDDRFVTDDLQPVLNSSTHRQSLLALATSASLEKAVREQLPAGMLPEDSSSGSLAGLINATTTGDLIQIEASGNSEADALALAEVWGKTYVDTINEIYGSNTTFIEGLEQQIKSSQQEYDLAQQELETFLRTSQQIALRQQISTLEGLLLQSNTANQTLYAQYVARTHELELILQDARTLREQSSGEQTTSFANNLAVLALRARAVGSVALPIQLQLDNADVLADNATLSVADLDRLIAVLEQRHDELVGLSQALAESIATGQGSAAALSTTTHAQYEEKLALLNQQLEEQNAQELLLKQRRDLALESLSILQRKLNEQRIVQGTPEITVRFVDAIIEPPRSRLMAILTYGTAAAVLGMSIGILIALYLELVLPRLSTWRAAPTERPVDRTVTGQDAA